MNLKFILFLSLFFYFNSNDNLIIPFPEKNFIFCHIKCKDDYLNYKRVIQINRIMKYDFEVEVYYIESSKNLYSIHIEEFKSTFYNNPLNNFRVEFGHKLILQVYNKKEGRDLFGQILYKQNIINNTNYIIEKNKHGEEYIFYGGSPTNLFRNLNYFSFKGNEDFISQIKIEFNNGTNNIIDMSEKKLNVQFDENEYIVCFPSEIFYLLKNSILKKYDDEYNRKSYLNKGENNKYYNISKFNINTYNLSRELKNIFPNFSITIGNKIFKLNKYNAFRNINENYTNLLIRNTSCYDEFHLGKYFFELFDYSEFNTRSGEVNLYLNKNKTFMIEKNLVLTSNLDIFVLFFCLIITSIFSINLIKKNYKKFELYHGQNFEMNNY